MNRNIAYIPGETSTMPATAHQTPGVPFLGNEVYTPLHPLPFVYQDAALSAPGIPVQGIMMTTPARSVPVLFYPQDIGAPAPDQSCITR